MKQDFACELTKKVTMFEKLMVEFAKDNEVEINRLMLIISDTIKNDIKNGTFELLKKLTVEQMEERLNKLKEKEDIEEVDKNG